MLLKKNAARSEVSIWSKSFVAVFLCSWIMHVSLEMGNSVLGKYADSIGINAASIGLIIGCYAFSALPLRIIGGAAMDAFDRRILLAFGLAALGIASFSYGFATDAFALGVGRLFYGVSLVFAGTGLMAYASDTLPKEKFGEGIFVFTLATTIAEAIAPSMGLGIASAMGYRASFFMAGVFAFLSIVFLAFGKSDTQPVRRPFKVTIDSFFAKESLIAAVLLFLLKLSQYCVAAFLVVYAHQQGVGDGFGIYFFIYAATMFVTRPVAGRLLDRLGTAPVVGVSIVFFAVSFLVISFADTLWMFLIAAVIGAFGYAVSYPALQTLGMKAVKSDHRGSATNTCYFAQDSGNFAGPIIAGMIADAFGYALMWRVMIIPMVVALVVVLVFRKRLASIDRCFLDG